MRSRRRAAAAAASPGSLTVFRGLLQPICLGGRLGHASLPPQLGRRG
eukprot:CAMPEP_0170438350 /NCGR_PEP_ID=MMETSP0117_2-20130122/45186_1 /TAXON_ID=400756 /ORGANISM="Durinskia baltica, Strain CSIRO CS-38" /LENGTH=46 /DNA_ID= /DNA_START= /DNA_END= /DNA_ORIENTATION=